MYADVALPVPLDQLFTYLLPSTLHHRVKPGSRLIVPFGSRKLTGVIMRLHDEPPQAAVKEAYRLLFRTTTPIQDSLRELEQVDDENVAHLVKFILSSKRGFIRV